MRDNASSRAAGLAGAARGGYHIPLATPIHREPRMRSLLLSCIPLLATSAPVVAQAVLPPFESVWQLTDLGNIPGIANYGGTAFSPTNPNVLLVAPYGGTTIYSVTVARDPSGNITGGGAVTPFATVGGTDGGLAFEPSGVLFATWYGPNNVSQLRPGSITTDRVDSLFSFGVASSVGTCAFVPAGLPGAGRFKVCSWSPAVFHDVPLTPDGNGTFAPGQASAGVPIATDIEGMVYMPASAPLLGGKLLLLGWTSGNITGFDIDANGDPIPSTATPVAYGTPGVGGGAVDPVSGNVVMFTTQGRMLVLRVGPVCGTNTSYGLASPGALGTPTLTSSGCARLGQTISLDATGPASGIGILAAGVQTNFFYLNLNVLQTLDVTVVSLLSPAGTASTPLSIPPVGQLGYAHLYLQVAYFDASTPSGLIASAGLDLLIR
jgi:hypothetical protein